MQNESQYDLDRKTARIFALSSNNLDKYEYLTGENMDLKPSTIVLFEYSPSGKSFNKCQETKDLMDEIEDANDDIDDGKLLFIGSNKEKSNFNTFNKPLNFISAIYNGEISLEDTEFKQRDLEKK